jgi:hypothetical protein
VTKKTPKSLDERVDSLEGQMKQAIELTNTSSEELRELRGEQRRLEKRVRRIEDRQEPE